MWTERRRTRDLLLEYDKSILPYTPIRQAGLPIIYPWEDFLSSQMSKNLYRLATENGFTGTLDEFLAKFATLGGSLTVGTIDTFPEEGADGMLYFDTQTEIVYYYNKQGHEYTPIRTLLIENTTLSGGSAAEYID